MALSQITVYCKILKISRPQTGNTKNPPLNRPSKYKPPKPVTQKNPPLNRPSKYKSPGKFTFNYKASPIDFETQISLRR